MINTICQKLLIINQRANQISAFNNVYDSVSILENKLSDYYTREPVNDFLEYWNPKNNEKIVKALAYQIQSGKVRLIAETQYR